MRGSRLAMLSVFVAGACGGDAAGPPDAELGEIFCENIADGCSCGRGAADELTECSPTSVAGPGALGFCCEDPFDCECHEVLCRAGPTGCACGSSFVVDEGAQVESCTELNCCRDAVGNYCLCSFATCAAGATQVGSCTMAGVMTCLEFQSPVPTCQ